jgi:hypothetical protein
VRRALVPVLSGLLLVAVAGPAGAVPSKKPPITVPDSSGIEWALQVQGFVTPNVLYRFGEFRDIVVIYDGAGSVDPVEATQRIEDAIWAFERARFDRLEIRNGDQAPYTITYADLEATLGPRSPGFGEVTLSNWAGAALALTARGSEPSSPFTNALEEFKTVAAAIAIAMVLAVLTIALVSLGRGRGGGPDDSTHRFFA